MKKVLMIAVLCLVVVSMVGMVLAQWNGNEYAYEQEEGPLRDGSCQDSVLATEIIDPPGPAPFSGDGEPDGSGMDSRFQAGESDAGRGPAPSSGDGDSDGPGWE